MAASDRFSIRVDARDLDRVIVALRAEEDGRALRNEMARSIRAVLKPAVQEAKGEIRSLPSTSNARPGLRASIARRVGYSVKLIGRDTRATVKARKTPNLRGFTNAAKRTQQTTWRARNWNGQWRDQRGKPGWFDGTLQNKRREYKEAIEAVLSEMASRIASRAGH